MVVNIIVIYQVRQWRNANTLSPGGRGPHGHILTKAHSWAMLGRRNPKGPH